VIRRSFVALVAFIAIACALAGCGRERTVPHAGGVARAALSRPGLAWRTEAGGGIHLHYLPDSYAAAHADSLARAAEAALRYDLALARMQRPPEPVELFPVRAAICSREFTRNSSTGSGGLTAFFVTVPGKPVQFRHEIMHALSLKLWGRGREATWMAEGVATWAGGSCQGHDADRVAAGFLRDGTLPSFGDLETRFWELEELHGYFTGGSAIAFVARSGGPAAVEALWKRGSVPREHPLGPRGAEIEAAWRRHLAATPPAAIDTARLRLHGCEAP